MFHSLWLVTVGLHSDKGRTCLHPSLIKAPTDRCCSPQTTLLTCILSHDCHVIRMDVIMSVV